MNLGSAHLPILISLQMDVTITPLQHRTSINLKKANWDRYSREIEDKLSKRRLPTDCQKGEKILHAIIRNAASDHIPSGQHRMVPTTPACTWWNRPEEDNSSGKLESTHPSRTSVKSDQGFFGVESVMRVNADSLLIRAAATSTSGTLNDLTTDLIMANNNNNTESTQSRFQQRFWKI